MELRVERTWDGREAPPGERATVEIEPRPEGLLARVEAPFHGDPPPPGPPGPTWGLWEFEAVELFVLGAGERYLEVEIGPHGHHLVLLLEGRRRLVARELPLEVSTVVSGPTWRAEAVLPWSWIPPPPHAVNAYALHGVGAARRYLAAWPVPGDAPDFHRLERFRSIPALVPPE